MRTQLSHALTEIPGNRAIRLSNETCPYCGHVLAGDSVTHDHVIGRRFIPRGKLAGNWNLIIQACRACNAQKSELEDDISAITMQPDLMGDHGHDDHVARNEARRKAEKSISRRTKRPVKDSREEIALKMKLGGGASITFKLTSPAQIDERRVFRLAWFHLMAFFYFVTFDHATKRGGYWQGGFFPVMTTKRGDWGNPVLRAFADAVADWEPRVFAATADSFFRIVIRRHPSAACWSWALEWNCTTRVVGFFGDEDAARAVAAGFPSLKLHTVAEGPDHALRMHFETPLKEEDDRLFYLSDECKQGVEDRTATASG